MNASTAKGLTVEPGHDLKTCETCKGAGQVVTQTRTIFGNIQQASTCPTCRGRGKIPEKVCTVCREDGCTEEEPNHQPKNPSWY